jgi:hypothetical protein
MANIIAMVTSIINHGVYATAYDDFVEYIVQATSPSNSRIGVTYATAVTDTVAYIILLIIIVIFIVFVFIVILLAMKKDISLTNAICIIIASAAIMLIYYISCRSFTQSISYELIPVFQGALVNTALYTANSALRDIVYLGLCE